MIVAILALVLAGAGVGYSAGTIGTSDLQNDAVTSPKIKNGTVSGADLSKQEKYKYAGANGVPFSDGGEGDCQWVGYDQLLGTLEAPGYRRDRDGVVHLTGIAIGTAGAGGDADCGNESEDGIVFTLPKKYWPARSQIRVVGTAQVVIAGKGGLETLPSGAVYVSSPSYGLLIADIEYPAAGTPLATKPTSARLSPQGRALLKKAGLYR